jgi:hypothetical protein
MMQESNDAGGQVALQNSIDRCHSFVDKCIGNPKSFIHQMEPSITYLIIAGLVFVILHSYLRHRMPRYLFHLLVFVHQVTLAGMSLLRYVRLGIQDRAGAIVRLFLLSFCILAEVEGFMLDNILYFN